MLENVIAKVFVLSTVAPFVIKTLIDTIEDVFKTFSWYSLPQAQPYISASKKIGSLILGLATALIFDLRAFEIVAIPMNPIADLVLTGIFLGKGSNVVNDLLGIIRNAKLNLQESVDSIK